MKDSFEAEGGSQDDRQISNRNSVNGNEQQTFEQQYQAQSSNQEYQNIDLTPYEEDDDAVLHQKLVAAKIARKRAEDDLKLLSNRISLLKQEESRAFKKIDQTRKKASDIISQRKRNMQMAAEKEMRIQMKLNEEAQITMLHKAQKEDLKYKIQSNKQGHAEKVKQDVTLAKQEKHEKKIQFYTQNDHHIAKAQMIKNLIKGQQEEAKEKKRRELIDKQMRAKQQMYEKMSRDDQVRLEHEQSVQQMEREELELIQRLKDTQMMQQSAFQQLENALQGSTMSQMKKTNKR